MQGDEFFEGVRCVLVDRKDTPKWKYERASDVPKEEVEEYFAPFKTSRNEELEL